MQAFLKYFFLFLDKDLKHSKVNFNAQSTQISFGTADQHENAINNNNTFSFNVTLGSRWGGVNKYEFECN